MKGRIEKRKPSGRGFPEDGSNATFEIFAPEGFCFEPDLHSLLAWSREEALVAQIGPFQRCEKDCDCKEAEDND